MRTDVIVRKVQARVEALFQEHTAEDLYPLISVIDYALISELVIRLTRDRLDGER
jgi:hypothetical protein